MLRSRMLGSLALTAFVLLTPLGAAAQPRQEWRIGTAPPGSLSYAVASGIALVTTERESGTRLSLQPHVGSGVVITLVNSGEIEFGLTLNGEAASAYRGHGKATPAPDIRMIMRVSDVIAGLMVRKDSPIRGIQDLPGKRVAGEYAAIPLLHTIMGGALHQGGLDWKDVRLVPVPGVNEGIEALIAGRVDVAYSSPLTAIAKKAEADVGVRFLTLDCSAEGQTRFRAAVPAVSLRTVKMGVMTEEACLTAPYFVLFTGKAMGAEPVRAILQAAWNGREARDGKAPRLAGIHPAFRGQRPEYAFDPEPPIPYHPAAVEFYRQQKGLDLNQLEEVQRRLLSAPR